MNQVRKRPRTAFSQDQVRCLEGEFARNKYLTVSRRVELSKELGLTENQVCNFDNFIDSKANSTFLDQNLVPKPSHQVETRVLFRVGAVESSGGVGR